MVEVKMKTCKKRKEIVTGSQNVLRGTFGLLKDSKIDPQKVKDELRKEWTKLD